MNQQALNPSEVRAEQAASKRLPTLKLTLDVHAGRIVVVRILDHRAPQPAQKFLPARFLEWIKTQLRLAGQVHPCYEAGPFGYDLHRDLSALGVRNRVVQPVCLDEQHKGVNHDTSDAKQLALRLDRSVAGHTPALATVCVPNARGRAKTHRKAGSDTGLCGGVSASGQSTHLLPVTKHGKEKANPAQGEPK